MIIEAESIDWKNAAQILMETVKERNAEIWTEGELEAVSLIGELASSIMLLVLNKEKLEFKVNYGLEKHLTKISENEEFLKENNLETRRI